MKKKVKRKDKYTEILKLLKQGKVVMLLIHSYKGKDYSRVRIVSGGICQYIYGSFYSMASWFDYRITNSRMDYLRDTQPSCFVHKRNPKDIIKCMKAFDTAHNLYIDDFKVIK